MAMRQIEAMYAELDKLFAYDINKNNEEAIVKYSKECKDIHRMAKIVMDNFVGKIQIGGELEAIRVMVHEMQTTKAYSFGDERGEALGHE